MEVGDFAKKSNLWVYIAFQLHTTPAKYRYKV